MVKRCKMKDRTADFKDYSWEIARQHKCSSEVAAIEAAMRMGYSMAVKDVNEDLGKTLKDLQEFRASNNAPK